MQASATMWSGVVPLPPATPSARRQSTSSAPPTPTRRARPISLASTTRDPLGYASHTSAFPAATQARAQAASGPAGAGALASTRDPPVTLRPRSSSLSSYTRRPRTPSHGSTASSASSDFPVTPAPPPPPRAPPSSGRWSATPKGPTMVDPRFLRHGHGASPPSVAHEPSFVASLYVDRTYSVRTPSSETDPVERRGQKPFLGPAGAELPLFSSLNPPRAQQTSYLPTSPLQAAFSSPASRDDDPIPAPTAASTFLPRFASSSCSPVAAAAAAANKSPRKPRTSERSSSFSRRVRRRSSPRKPASIRRRHSSSSSPHRREGSASSGPALFRKGGARPDSRRRSLRPRSHSVPDLRSHARATLIPFDTFSPRSPYAHARDAPRRPSIADELLSGEVDASHLSHVGNGTTARDETTAVVFPSRSDKGKGKGRPTAAVPPRRSSAVLAHATSRGDQAPRMLPPPRVVVSSLSHESAAPPKVKGSLMVPHPRLVVSGTVRGRREPAGDDYAQDDEVESIQQRYERTAARSDDGADAESVDHSSLLRVLRENEESRKEREGWSDSATKSLGSLQRLGLGLGLEAVADLDRKHQQRRNGGRTRADRKKVRKQVELEKHRAADSGTDGEGGSGQSRPRRPEASPPMPHSFEPFVHFGRRLSLSRTKSRPPVDVEPPTSRTVRGKPIRHLRTSPSVDSIFSRTGPPAATEYGRALSENVPLGEQHRRPSLTSQNAFLSLPPHLHHLLRSPERESYAPSRSAPPVPLAPASAKDSNRLSTSSVASAARLSLALESHLSQGPPLAVDAAPPSGGGRVHPYSLSPLPEVESPESQRSAHSHSDASSGLHLDTGGNSWQGLFFSPPRRDQSRPLAHANHVDPHVSIMVASEDEDTSTEGTDDTFSIRRLERTRQSLEALFTTAATDEAETAQETLLLPTVNGPAVSRSTSAQASFVTARETPSDSARPLPTPAQTPWASTSFACEYLDGLEGAADDAKADSPPDRSLAVSNRAASRASKHSYIDFDGEDDDDDAAGPVEPAVSPNSFLDDFSPPSSAPASPAIAAFPRDASPGTPRLLPAAATAPFEPGSLPTSPTLTSTFDEGESKRCSRIAATNRESYLSVDSHNLRISPTAARFANGGTTTPRTTPSYTSSRSTMLNCFPVPPVVELEHGHPESARDGDHEGGDDEEEETEREVDRVPRMWSDADDDDDEDGAEETTPSTSSSPTTTVATTDSPATTMGSRSARFPDRPRTSDSFLDVSDASDSESKRWSRGTFQTFYSGSKRHNLNANDDVAGPVPPLPPPARR
ncbi:hypothetical protein JCM11491_006183 [Sporobolomyces phaffii]